MSDDWVPPAPNPPDDPLVRFEEFVRARTASLWHAAYLLTGDRHHAEDLLQTALERTAVRWDRLDRPEAYVRKVLYTQAVSWWRRRQRRVPEVLVDATPEPPGGAGEPEVRIVLAQALRRLTAKQRAVLVLRFYEDCTEEETARLLGVAPGTVKSQTRHALGRLRQLAPELAGLLGDPDGTPTTGRDEKVATR
ncbi:SigE family RNA polymerase sigma factor [Catellatospora vulcania]|uniref:SigE family RNA polymerase sigma factor n=1 Tax=Catellatospora vulcania TaxID=1460450 RepID=UPI0012D3CFFD|nr:SigE family RNA polymerase sigma factor [Catellatospora vulcania]